MIYPQQKPGSKVSCHQLKPKPIIAFRTKIATNCFRKYHLLWITRHTTKGCSILLQVSIFFVRGEVSQILHLYEITLKIASSSNLAAFIRPRMRICDFWRGAAFQLMKYIKSHSLCLQRCSQPSLHTDTSAITSWATSGSCSGFKLITLFWCKEEEDKQNYSSRDLKWFKLPFNHTSALPEI